MIDQKSIYYGEVLKVERIYWIEYNIHIWKIENKCDWFWEEDFIASAGIKYIEISSKLKNFV